MDDAEKKLLKEKLKIHPESTVHQYYLWMPIDIYLELYKIQEDQTISINDQIVEILKKHFKFD